ncbi:MAG: hypothetical protein KAT70_07580 [Thermoplasmata archaeon]|nr:hypothetical protein [Thermoplasmata archaeon]
MCHPFHEKDGGWRRFSSTWVCVLRGKTGIDDVNAFILNKKERAREMGMDMLFASGKAVEGEEHLLTCALHALRRWNGGTARTRDIGMETLLYVAGSPHVNKAIAEAGLEEGDSEVWMVAFSTRNERRLSASEMIEWLGMEPLPIPWRTERAGEALERAALLEIAQ